MEVVAHVCLGKNQLPENTVIATLDNRCILVIVIAMSTHVVPVTTPPDNDAIRDLRAELKDLNKTMKEANAVNERLSFLLSVIAFFQLVVSIFQAALIIYGPGLKSEWITVAGEAVVGAILIYFAHGPQKEKPDTQ